MDGIIWEFRRTLADIANHRTDWRRIGFRALPFVGIAGVGVGALCIKRRINPPDEDFLSHRSQFRCVPITSALGGIPVERLLCDAGVDVAALRRAARRLRGPIEGDILGICSLGSQSQAQQRVEELVRSWSTAGYLEEPEEHLKPAVTGVDFITQLDESYGRDVGCEVPLVRLAGTDGSQNVDLRSLSMGDHAAVHTALREHGVVRLQDFVAPSAVQAMRDSLNMQVSALDSVRGKGGAFPLIREYDSSRLQQDDPDLQSVMSTPGRVHFNLRGRPLELLVRDAQAAAIPLVWDYLMAAAQASGLPAESRLYVSEVQLLISEPCAADQFWHADNVSPGLTLIVPLTQAPEEVGATLLLPGTHHLLGETHGFSGFVHRLRRFLAAFLASDGVVVGTLNAGDALLYDSRVLHRGAANRLYDRTRVVLVFRYDFERPPGVGVVGTQVMSWAGNILAALQRLYAALPRGVVDSSGGSVVAA